MSSDHLRGVERDEPEAQALASSRGRTWPGDAIAMTPARMGRSRIHFIRERLGSKRDVRSSGPLLFLAVWVPLVRLGRP